jgi:hypothetical protein
MRELIRKLVALGPLPDEDAATEEQLETLEKYLSGIEKPVSDEEAEALAKLFGPDNCYGLAWTLLHLIETAPGWPLRQCFVDVSNEWIKRLRERAERSGLSCD